MMKLRKCWFILLLVINLQPFCVHEANAGAEYVFVQKAMDDNAIIITHNGDAYLIEKGVGCLSLWRYEGKSVLINSPGIFLGTGSELLILDLGQKCRVWNPEYLGSVKEGSYPPTCTPKKSISQDDCTNKHWIQSKSNGGSIIILGDMSIWEVNAVDRVDSMLWLPTENVIVCRGRMINLRNGKKVEVIRLK
jgi:hypothetical protein